MTDPQAAVRYGRALFEVASEHHGLNRVRTDLETWDRLLQADPRIRAFCAASRHDAGQERDFIDTACGSYMGNLCLRTVRIMVRNGRLAVLPLLPAAFRDIEARASHRVRVSVEAARVPEQAVLQDINAVMERKTGGPVTLTTTVNAALLGGFRIWWNNNSIDLSVTGRFSRLQRVLKTATMKGLDR